MNPIHDTKFFMPVLHISCPEAETLFEQGSPLGNSFCVIALTRIACVKAIMEHMLSLPEQVEVGKESSRLLLCRKGSELL